MRKELGKPTRDAFFTGLRAIAPGFARSSAFDIKGFTWTFERRQEALRQWIWFQQHKNDDSFTVEISWSCRFDDPAQPRIGSPEDAFQAEGVRFRLGAFWEQGGDYWWPVADPRPSILDLSPEEYLASIASPPPIHWETARPRIDAAVGDALGRVREHALPYFTRVIAWTKTLSI